MELAFTIWGWRMDGWVGTLDKGSSLGIVRIARAQLSTDWNQSKIEALRLTRIMPQSW